MNGWLGHVRADTHAESSYRLLKYICNMKAPAQGSTKFRYGQKLTVCCFSGAAIYALRARMLFKHVKHCYTFVVAPSYLRLRSIPWNAST